MGNGLLMVLLNKAYQDGVA